MGFSEYEYHKPRLDRLDLLVCPWQPTSLWMSRAPALIRPHQITNIAILNPGSHRVEWVDYHEKMHRYWIGPSTCKVIHPLCKSGSNAAIMVSQHLLKCWSLFYYRSPSAQASKEMALFENTYLSKQSAVRTLVYNCSLLGRLSSLSESVTIAEIALKS